MTAWQARWGAGWRGGLAVAVAVALWALAGQPAGAQAAAPAPGAAAAVRLPPSAKLDYQVKGSTHGLDFSADASLIWDLQPARYQAQWVVRMPLLGQRVQRSEGAVTDAGLAPERYVENARKERSAQFDAASRSIRFSGGAPAVAWQPGTQDRLSVSLQLGGLLAAAPQRYAPGSVLTVHTAGVRGAEPWHWRVHGEETLRVGGQALKAVKLERQPRKDKDSRVELWLAPSLQYLPARLRVSQEDGEVADQQLKALPGTQGEK